MLYCILARGLVKMNALNQGEKKEEGVRLDVVGENEEETEEKKPEFRMEAKKSKPGAIGRPLFWQVTTIILFILLVIVFFSSYSKATADSVSESDAQAIVKDYVDTVLQGQPFSAEVGEAAVENGMYRIEVVINDQPIFSYLSLDGKLFFPNAVDLERFELLRDSIDLEEIDVGDTSGEAIENNGEDISEETTETIEEAIDNTVIVPEDNPEN